MYKYDDWIMTIEVVVILLSLTSSYRVKMTTGFYKRLGYLCVTDLICTSHHSGVQNLKL